MPVVTLVPKLWYGCDNSLGTSVITALEQVCQSLGTSVTTALEQVCQSLGTSVSKGDVMPDEQAL